MCQITRKEMYMLNRWSCNTAIAATMIMLV